jgi:DhnA family fructose-bisphosphate aldolase class Ia
MTYLFVGLDDPAAEAAQVDLNARVSRACEEYGLVRILEPMARGRRVGGDMFRPEYIAVHARMAAELGADIVKTDYSGDGASYRAVVDGCPVPIFIAGGPRTATTREALSMVSEARAVGVRGLMFGRNIVQADDPRKMTAAMASIVYRGASVDEALRVLEGAAVPAGGAT